jgi:hypothetical protein
VLLLIPLYIVSIGRHPGDGRRLPHGVLPVMMVLIDALLAGLSDATMRRERFVAWGLILSG